MVDAGRYRVRQTLSPVASKFGFTLKKKKKKKNRKMQHDTSLIIKSQSWIL